MQKKYPKYCIIAALAGLLSACTATDGADGTSQTLNMTLDGVVGVQSRAASDIQDAAFQTGEDVRIWVWDAGVLGTATGTYAYTNESQTDIQYKVAYVDESSTLIPADQIAFRFPTVDSDKKEKKVNIRACYPAREKYTNATDINLVNLRTIPTTFTIQTDQSTAEGYKASDLMYGLPTNGNPVKNTNSLVGMTFRHTMAKVVINITAGQGIDDLTGIDVTLDCVLTASVKTNTTSYDMVVEPSGGATGTVKMNSADQVSGKKQVTMAAVVPPQEIAHEHPFITIKRGDVSYVYRPTTNITFLSCSLNTFYITVEEYRLIVSGSITPWNTGSGDEFLLTGTIYEVTAREENP